MIARCRDAEMQGLLKVGYEAACTQGFTLHGTCLESKALYLPQGCKGRLLVLATAIVWHLA